MFIMIQRSGNSGINLVKTENERSESVELGHDDDSAPVNNTHTGCGFGRCRPRFLQMFANPIVFMIVLIMYCFLEGAIASGESRVPAGNVFVHT